MAQELNLTLYQSFHWYLPADGTFWQKMKSRAVELKELGIGFIWLPPAYKSDGGPNGVGYGVYDLYDLGEFDQKGTVRTKYGTKEEYIECVKTFQELGIKVIVDIVLNHRCGGDEKEKVRVRDVDRQDRNKMGKPYEREITTKFTFPGRKGLYSSFVWDFNSFTAVDDPEDEHNAQRFYLIESEHNQGFDQVPSSELGNFDYLLGADVNFRNIAVRTELKNWGEWYYNTVPFDGMRLDAVKHMNSDFINEWVQHVKAKAGKELLLIGEDWTQSTDGLTKYKELSCGKIQLFDVPLHYSFHRASTDLNFDMRALLDGALVKVFPELAITFVENHDTQPLQGLESPVDFWFQPLGYAVILLRQQGIPCVFATSLFGAKYSDKGKDGKEHKVELVPPLGIKEMMSVRSHQAYGTQRDYFDHERVIGWTREGTDEHPNSGCAVLLSSQGEGEKYMEVGKRHAGNRFTDALGKVNEEVSINQDGWGLFKVKARSVSVWIARK